MRKQKKKGGIVALVAFFVLIIPLLIAFLILRDNMDSDLKKGSVVGVSIFIEGKETRIEESKKIDFFINVATSGEPIRQAADDLSAYRKCEIVFHKPKNDLSYSFYLSDSVNNCVYTDPRGELYLIPADLASDVLAHSVIGGYAISFAERPKLMLEQGGKRYGAAAIKGEWVYSKTNSSESAKKIDEAPGTVSVLPQGEMIQPVFSIRPDFCTVRLMGPDGRLMYSGSFEEMQKVVMDQDAHLELIVSCDWYAETHSEYHGSLEYRFDLFYDVPTLCSIDRTQAMQGESFAVTVAHSSSESVAVIATFSSEKVTPEKRGDLWVATVFVPKNVTPASYEIILMGSDVDRNFAVTVLPSEADDPKLK